MKTALKYLTIVALAITALTQPSMKVGSTEEEEDLYGDENVTAREAYRRLQLQDENGQIPPDGWTNAYEQEANMPFLLEAWSEFVPTGAEVPNPWVSIGPGNIGGRIRSIIIHPNPHPEIIWAGAVSGGVWKSTNGGTTWSTSTDSLANLAVNCMVMDPTDPNILYAGTGEGFPTIDGVQGDGIFKTIDGGNYWAPLRSTVVTPTNMNFAWVNRLGISPADPQILLAATRSGVFRSTDGGDQWSAPTGLPGAVWADVRFKPLSIVAEAESLGIPAINCLVASLDGSVYYSTDSGATWTTNTESGLPPPAAFQRIELAYSRTNPSIVYASKGGITGSPAMLYRSENGGFTSPRRDLVPRPLATMGQTGTTTFYG
jgi:hypothetical protein